MSKVGLARGVLLSVGLAVGLASPAAAAPGDMSAGAFLAKADALQAKGAMALFSSDIGLLKAEGMAAGQAYRSRLLQERAVGHPSSCAPHGTRVDSTRLLGFLRAYPAAERQRKTMREAMAELFMKTWPCR